MHLYKWLVIKHCLVFKIDYTRRQIITLYTFLKIVSPQDERLFVLSCKSFKDLPTEISNKFLLQGILDKYQNSLKALK